jgi:hypothetical protein
MSHTDHDFDDLIGALRTELPTAEDRERIRARLEAAGVLAAGTAAMAGMSAASGAAPGALASLAPKSLLVTKLAALGTVPKVMVVAASISAVSLPVAVQLWTQEPTAPAEARSLPGDLRQPSNRPPDGRQLIARKSEDLAAGAVAAGPGLEGAIPNVPKAQPKPAKSLASPAPVSDMRPRSQVSHGSLKDETALIDQALAALRRGDAGSARALLNEHQQRFPHGALEPERKRALARLDLETKTSSQIQQ